MPKAFEFCIPTRRTPARSGKEWLHEIKYEGYRLRMERDHDRVRLITKGGHDWTKRYPWIVEAARKNRVKQFILDGEAVGAGRRRPVERRGGDHTRHFPARGVCLFGMEADKRSQSNAD
jgi:ATP-dependent DNA ligase